MSVDVPVFRNSPDEDASFVSEGFINNKVIIPLFCALIRGLRD